MKLRQTPEDFVVEEVPDFTPDPAGRFFVYQITKRSLATLEVLEILRKTLRLASRDVSASGMKDKHAVATQLISLPRPLPATFHNPGFDWKFVGKSSGRLTADNVGGNRFTITARSLTLGDLEGLEENRAGLLAFGVPNYYDSQRFGGGGPTELPGRALVRGDWLEALRMHLAVPRRKQSMKDKRIRRVAAEHWGNWDRILKDIPRCREHAVFGHLAAMPDDLVGALERCDEKILQIYVAAFQSHLFNQTLIRLVERQVPPADVVPVGSKGGRLLFWRKLPKDVAATWNEMMLPLLAHDSELAGVSTEVATAVRDTLAEEGTALDELRVKGLKRVRLRAAQRPPLVKPSDLTVEGPLPDELNAGKLKLVTSFGLPKGAFATIVLKRLGLRARVEGESGSGVENFVDDGLDVNDIDG